MVTEGGERQTLQFIEKGPASFAGSEEEAKDGKLVTLVDGVSTETVVSVLLDRLYYLNQAVPSSHNDQAIAHLEGVQDALRRRTQDRKERGIEGTDQA